MPRRPARSRRRPSGPGVHVSKDAVAIGDASRSLSEGARDEEVLQKYLSLVYELRGVRPGGDVSLRDADLALLADVLGDTTDEIESRLVRLIHCTREEARAIRRALLRRRLAVPAMGVVMGVGALTPHLAAADDSPPNGGVPAPAPAPTAEVTPKPAPAPPPAAEVAPEPEPAPAEPERGTDWAEIIDPLVIERDDPGEG